MTRRRCGCKSCRLRRRQKQVDEIRQHRWKMNTRVVHTSVMFIVPTYEVGLLHRSRASVQAIDWENI